MRCVVTCCAVGYIRVAAGLLSRLRKNLDTRSRLYTFFWFSSSQVVILSDVVSTNNNAETKKNKIDGNQRLCDTCVRTGPGWSTLANKGHQQQQWLYYTPKVIFIRILLCVAVSALFLLPHLHDDEWWWRYAPTVALFLATGHIFSILFLSGC